MTRSAYSLAIAAESSVLPSSTTMSSQLSRGNSLRLRFPSMMGSTDCPFFTGTTIER